MKKIILGLLTLLPVTAALAQKNPTNKVVISSGQKVNIESTMTTEASVMGFDINNSTIMKSTVEVKGMTADRHNLTTTTTYIKLDMDMVGNNVHYDSDKPGSANDEIGKAAGEKLNKPVNLLLDPATGKAVSADPEKKKSGDDSPLEGLSSLGSDISEEAMVTGAFELIPAGKKVGDSWSDSISTKESKTVRNFTLRSIEGDVAIIDLKAKVESTIKLEMQEMEMEMKSTTNITGDITTDITTGRVKQRNSVSEINGTMQLMGQDVPVTAKATAKAIYN